MINKFKEILTKYKAYYLVDITMYLSIIVFLIILFIFFG